jgi:transcription elongation factor SPT4
VFEGLIALREPVTSWVARWQRVDGFVKGMYAVSKLPEEVVQELAENNKTYIARDGSYQAED